LFEKYCCRATGANHIKLRASVYKSCFYFYLRIYQRAVVDQASIESVRAITMTQRIKCLFSGVYGYNTQSGIDAITLFKRFDL